jgi:hypothetical protein
LDGKRVDPLTATVIARRVMSQPLQPFLSGVEKFGQLTERDKESILSWGILAVAADCATQRTINEPTEEFRVDALPCAPDDSITNINQDDTVVLAADEGEEERVVASARESKVEQPTPSRRVVRFSRQLREACQSLGLSTSFVPSSISNDIANKLYT